MRTVTFKHSLYASLLVGSLVGGPMALAQSADEPSNNGHKTPVTNENTRENRAERWEQGKRPTADQAGQDKKDIQLAAQIRRSLMKDKGLSFSAKNVKIISENGFVTLKGPVKSDDERQLVLKKAQQLAGDNDVKDELEIAR